jgi:hypothetical protein
MLNRPVNRKRPKPTHIREPRFTVVRNVSRKTGEASWGIIDGRRYDGTPPVIFIGETLKEALLECERLNRPPERIKYHKRGQTGFVTNDEVEDEE